MNEINKADKHMLQALANRLTMLPFSGKASLVFFGTEINEDGTWAKFGVRCVAEDMNVFTTKSNAAVVDKTFSPARVEVRSIDGLLWFFIRLSKNQQLPDSIPLPPPEPGIQIGVNPAGCKIVERLETLGHIMVGGMTGAGKSVFLRSLAFQAALQGARLVLIDGDQTTFTMMEGTESLLFPIGDFETAAPTLQAVVSIMENRKHAFKALEADSLEEYNVLSNKPEQRILVIVDEFNAIANSQGDAIFGPIEQIAWRGRKFGVHLVLAAQTFEKSVVGKVRDQLGTKIAFRVSDGIAARVMALPGAEKITIPGRALTNRWGLIQTFYVDKSYLGATTAESSLTVAEQKAVDWIRENKSGLCSFNNLLAAGLTRSEVEVLREKLKTFGLVQILPANKMVLREKR